MTRFAITSTLEAECIASPEFLARSRSRRQRLGAWLGLSLIEDDDPLGGKGAPLVGSFARRLAYLAAGAGIVRVLGLLTPPWVGLAVLVVWFLPLFYRAALLHLGVVFIVPLIVLAAIWGRNWPVVGRLVGIVVLTALEEGGLVLTFALLGGSLL
jgi:hypothetical protein